MTTIVADKRTLTMASDSQMQGHRTPVVKIHKGFYDNKAWLLGGAGSFPAILSFVNWFNTPDDVEPPDMSDVWVLALAEDGELAYYAQVGMPVDIKEDYFAIGSGGDYAMGAMDAGMDPYAAVEIAIGRDAGSGGAVQVQTFDKS